MLNLDPENQKLWLQHQQEAIKGLGKIFPVAFLCLGVAITIPTILSMLFDYQGIATEEGHGLWKIARKGTVEYCDVKTDTDGKPKEGHCITVKSLPKQ